MSYLTKKNRSILTRCFFACQKLVTLLLVFTLLVMLMGLGISIYYDEIPVPEPVEEIVNDVLNDIGLDLEYKKITIDLRANLLIEDATLSFTQAEDPAVKVDSIYLDVNYAALVLGKIPLNKLIIDNGRVFSPGIVSLSGTSDQVLEAVNLSITKKWNTWDLSFFTARFQNLDISGKGNLSALIRKLQLQKKKDQEPPNLYLDYIKLMQAVSENSKYLQSLENPSLELNFLSPSGADFLVDVYLRSDSFSWEGFPKVTDIQHQTTAQILPTLSLTKPTQTQVELIESEEFDIKIQDVNIWAGEARTVSNLQHLFPLPVETTTGEISVQGNTVDHVLFTGQLLGQDHAKGHLVASVFNRPLQANLKGNWKEQTASGHLSGSLNLGPIIERPELDHLWKLRWSKQNKPIYLDLDFNYPGDLENVTASFRVETRDIDIIKTPFRWARVRGTLQGTEVNVPYLVGGGYGNDLFCTFRQDLKKRFYRFTMKGPFRPHDIDIWWRDWWKKTFDYLDIKGELPFMDLSIRNAFRYKKQLTLFGYAEGKNINLKGMHFDEAKVKMFVRPNYIDALELKLIRPEGKATGQFQRQLVQSKLKNVIVDITSNIDLEPSMELFGESGQRIIEPYTWDGNPTITLLGEFNFENESNWQDLLFKIDTDNPMTLYKFPFDSLHVDGHYDYGDVLLHEVEFDFAGGQGQGEASYLKQEDQSFLLFDFSIEDADLEETLKRIAIVKKAETPSEKIDRKSKKPAEPIEGKLKVHASGVSPAGFGLDRVMAKGDIEITEGNLAQIPLFGPLSALIPFTKLRLNTAEAYFAWDEGKMTFPNLRMKSNTARLDGIGDFYTNSSNLDFQVRLYLLREAEIPLISSVIMPLLDPFSTIGSVNLKGTLTKPEWRFALSPFNLFDPKPGLESTQSLETLSDFEFRK